MADKKDFSIPIKEIVGEPSLLSNLVLNSLAEDKNERIFTIARETKRLDIRLVIEGEEFLVQPFLERLDGAIQERADDIARLKLDETIGGFCDEMHDLQESMRELIKKRFPDIEFDEY